MTGRAACTATLVFVLGAAHACAKDEGAPASNEPDAAGASEDAAASPAADASADAAEQEAGGEDDEGTFDDPDDAGAVLEVDARAGDGGCNQADIEPNDDFATARPLASTTDCDKNGNKIRGTLSGAGDVDFFHFHGNDNAFCEVNPSAAVDAKGVRLCMYAKCDSPTGSTSCGSGSKATAPAGYAGGCCIDGPATLDMGVDCPGLNDSATIYLRTSAIGATSCKTYAITYHY